MIHFVGCIRRQREDVDIIFPRIIPTHYQQYWRVLRCFCFFDDMHHPLGEQGPLHPIGGWTLPIASYGDQSYCVSPFFWRISSRENERTALILQITAIRIPIWFFPFMSITLKTVYWTKIKPLSSTFQTLSGRKLVSQKLFNLFMSTSKCSRIRRLNRLSDG